MIMTVVEYDGIILNIENNVYTTESEIKEIRNKLLANTDTWGLKDYPSTPAQLEYRQALRDLTEQANFPNNIIWPTKPE